MMLLDSGLLFGHYVGYICLGLTGCIELCISYVNVLSLSVLPRLHLRNNSDYRVGHK